MLVRNVILVRDLVDIEIVSELLKRTVAGSYTCRTVAVVLGKDEFDICESCISYLLGVSPDDHSFFYCGIAGSGKTLLTFDLYNTHAACTDLVQSFPLAEGRDIDPDGLSRIEDSCSLGNTYFLIIDSYTYHLNSLPPLSFPQPK